MELQLKIIGILLISLSFVHVLFPKYFNWKNELKSLSLINRQMMQIHTIFIAFIVLIMGVLCLTSSRELVNTDLGKRISFGLGLFWGLRLIIQFIGYSPELWKGKKFETTIHILFSILWTYLTFTFFIIFLN